jgi:hypothetical protein
MTTVAYEHLLVPTDTKPCKIRLNFAQKLKQHFTKGRSNLGAPGASLITDNPSKSCNLKQNLHTLSDTEVEHPSYEQNCPPEVLLLDLDHLEEDIAHAALEDSTLEPVVNYHEQIIILDTNNRFTHSKKLRRIRSESDAKKKAKQQLVSFTSFRTMNNPFRM